MRKYPIFLVLFFSIFALFTITSCSEAAGLKSQILGKWVELGVNGNSIEFLKEGTVIVVDKSMSAAGDYRFIDDKRLKVDLKGLLGAKVFEVNVNTKTGEMSLKEPNGKVSNYLTEAEFARRTEVALKAAAEAERKRTKEVAQKALVSTLALIEKDMVLVKGGCFEMGDTFGDGQVSEKPVHDVCVNDFYVGRYEVTQRQWVEVMGTNQFDLKCCEHWPVYKVSWNDVQNFIRSLNQKTGKNYRLPTEAEWEYAARSGGKREKFAGTSSDREVGEYAWYFLNSVDSPHPVGQKKPNELGLYDMSGNAWEWAQDWFDLSYYSNSPKDNPKGPLRGQERVLRGGDTLNLRSVSSRSAARPDDNYACCGFRLSRTK